MLDLEEQSNLLREARAGQAPQTPPLAAAATPLPGGDPSAGGGGVEGVTPSGAAADPPEGGVGAVGGGGHEEKKRPKLWGAGIVTPWLYYMGAFSTFGMHFEDYAFGSANVIIAEPGTQAWAI
eukprot:765606-Prorocentrum_minimum.AAC.1